MNTFLELIQFIAEQFQLWTTVDPDELGVRIRWGRKVKELGPGIHYMIPVIDSIRSINAKTQVIDLLDQSLDTADKTSIVISGAIEYSIVSARKTLIDIQDFDTSLTTYANGVIAGVVAQNAYDVTNIFTLQEAIYDSMVAEEDEWGIEIAACYVSTFTKNRVLRVLS